MLRAGFGCCVYHDPRANNGPSWQGAPRKHLVGFKNHVNILLAGAKGVRWSVYIPSFGAMGLVIGVNWGSLLHRKSEWCEKFWCEPIIAVHFSLWVASSSVLKRHHRDSVFRFRRGLLPAHVYGHHHPLWIRRPHRGKNVI